MKKSQQKKEQKEVMVHVVTQDRVQVYNQKLDLMRLTMHERNQLVQMANDMLGQLVPGSFDVGKTPSNDVGKTT